MTTIKLALTAALLGGATLPAQADTSGIRHITQQFGAWSLTCNENTVAKTKVCSVSQDVFGNGGALAFHWELSDAPGGKTRATILLAPLLSNSVIVLRNGTIGTIVDQIKCTPAQCQGSTILPEASLAVLKAGGVSSAQFIYMNAIGSVIALTGAGFADAWRAMRAEVPDASTGSIKPKHQERQVDIGAFFRPHQPAIAQSVSDMSRFH